MADYRERLADRVRYEREREQLSREELALRAGLNPKTIERIEEQKIGNPRGHTIRSLAKALKVEATDLNPPAELEEERLERLEEKVDEIQETMDEIVEAMALLLAGKGDADDARRFEQAAEWRREKRQEGTGNG